MSLADLPLCAFKAFTGIDCPGCGLTRAFVSLLRGDISKSIVYHPLGIIISAYLLYLMARLVVRFVSRKKVPALLGNKARWVAFHAFLAALFVNWIVTLAIAFTYGGFDVLR